MAKTVRRLVHYFKPESYLLDISIDQKEMSVSGVVTMKGQKVGRPSQRLTLHQKDLKITSGQIIRHDKSGDREIPISRINCHRSYDEIRIHASEVLYPGNYSVMLHYEAKITEPMHGIYPCFYDYNNQKQMLIATQFESHHAREAFPCIDEPEAKATFTLRLTTMAGQTVLSNTPLLNKTSSTTTETCTFATTPKMSTYLVAFVCGNMDYLEAKTSSGVTVRTYATPDNAAHTKFALDVAVRCLEFYNRYFAIDYPLDKCDLVALPDFASGAMENWGCITFREQTLLVDPDNTSLAVKQYVAMVIAHELAHQWFGNLVTMRWWTDLWLNEGFASWIEYLAVNECFPEWDIWTQFVVDEQERALTLDALQNTHPIEVKIQDPEEISSIFDTISYCKGSSVIHMLHNYLGADMFRNGLRHYLKTHAYGNTDTVDLWTALEQISKRPVREFMNHWTTRPGFPLVTVATERLDETVRVSQERFSYTVSDTDNQSVSAAKSKNSNPESTEWSIPLLSNGSLGSDTLISRSEVFSITKVSDAVVLNTNGAGFYRTHYSDKKMLQNVRDCFIAGSLPIQGQLRILSDSLEVAKANFGDSLDFVTLVEGSSDQQNVYLWDIIVGGLISIRAVMNDETLREDMKPFGRSLVAVQLDRLGWSAPKNESHFDTLLRPIILGLASSSNEKSVVEEALKRFSDMKQSIDVDPNLRGVVYGTAAREGNQKSFNKLLSLYRKSTNSEDKLTISSALTGFRQADIVEQALALILTDTVRLQDVFYWIAYSFSNRYARDLTWQWVTKNWKWLEENLSADLSFAQFPVYAARGYSDASFLPTYKEFFEAHMRPAIKLGVAQGIEIIEYQSKWRQRDLSALKKFFKAKS
jgi:aminopeptidase N